MDNLDFYKRVAIEIAEAQGHSVDKDRLDEVFQAIPALIGGAARGAMTAARVAGKAIAKGATSTKKAIAKGATSTGKAVEKGAKMGSTKFASALKTLIKPRTWVKARAASKGSVSDILTRAGRTRGLERRREKEAAEKEAAEKEPTPQEVAQNRARMRLVPPNNQIR